MTEQTVEYATDVATLPDPEMSTSALVLDTEAFDKIMAVAEVMAGGRATVPKHLQGSPADCMAIIIQSMQWKMNPFVVAQKTHLVNGTLGYEAQLVNAVVCASGAIEGGFHYEYGGDWSKFKPTDKNTEVGLWARAGAVLKGTGEITWGEPLYIAEISTRNSPLWKTNPKQQMGYLCVKNWTRLYAPGPLLGIYSVDELQDNPAREKDITPRKTATDYAETAKNSSDHELDTSNVIADLEIVAKDQGEDALKKAWNGLTKEMRKAIGLPCRDRLLAMASAVDVDIKQTHGAIDAETGEVTPEPSGDLDDNPFTGV